MWRKIRFGYDNFLNGSDFIFFDYSQWVEWEDTDHLKNEDQDEFDQDKVEDMERSSNCKVQTLTNANWVRVIDQN